MKINNITPDQFQALLHSDSDAFLQRLSEYEAFIVKGYLSKEVAQKIRNETFRWGQKEEATWHPLKDGCPDYHRLHDNYPKAWVQQKFHGFYRHGYYSSNQSLLAPFLTIFKAKNFLGGFDENAHIHDIPSQGIVARLNIHHYPKGGGYQSEHIDPDGPFAKIQTLIIASSYGQDYKQGGVYVRHAETGEQFFLDPYTEIGDMIVIAPGLPHGVSPIDPSEEYSPESNDGRWLLLPLFLTSDYQETTKPQQVSNSA